MPQAYNNTHTNGWNKSQKVPNPYIKEFENQQQANNRTKEKKAQYDHNMKKG